MSSFRIQMKILSRLWKWFQHVLAFAYFRCNWYGRRTQVLPLVLFLLLQGQNHFVKLHRNILCNKKMISKNYIPQWEISSGYFLTFFGIWIFTPKPSCKWVAGNKWLWYIVFHWKYTNIAWWLSVAIIISVVSVLMLCCAVSVWCGSQTLQLSCMSDKLNMQF